ncbi:subclass B1 metallo-beta-lactamase [Flagellimonas meishanensis]|uniref:subclass B1 metallo-beta-lactamase n=1 Tax=Flagellimonas meishanensis TaxID=2873264 RepID=UPI001CA7086D|nr:subclass B1 metallo-beta-lactamase [[Muricauda] meishanensis]
MNKTYLYSLMSLFLFGCKAEKSNILYESETLIIKQLSENSFQHITYLETDSWGKVPCNGLIVVADGHSVIFDTPTNNAVSHELINWVGQALKCDIKAVVATHFHEDCLGGLAAFHSEGIPSYAHAKTIELVNGKDAVVPQNDFSNTKVLEIGKEHIILDYLGEGHTPDNIIGYFPKDKVLFGGCLLKSLGAGKGYLGDANIDAWPKTVAKAKSRYKDAMIIIPGHGDAGDRELFDYTIKLFETKK